MKFARASRCSQENGLRNIRTITIIRLIPDSSSTPGTMGAAMPAPSAPLRRRPETRLGFKFFSLIGFNEPATFIPQRLGLVMNACQD